jgi:hypothetical protein
MPPAATFPSASCPTAAELAAIPGAERWARECEWLPGTGHCRNRGCVADCLFRPQREAEAAAIIRRRRRRRTVQHRLGERPGPR